jgi:hypothetical protein
VEFTNRWLRSAMTETIRGRERDRRKEVCREAQQ